MQESRKTQMRYQHCLFNGDIGICQLLSISLGQITLKLIPLENINFEELAKIYEYNIE